MNDIDFDLEAIRPLPTGLRSAATAVRDSAAVPCPDTGATTTATATGLQRLASDAAELARDLDRLAERIERCVAVYADADVTAGLWHQALLIGAMS